MFRFRPTTATVGSRFLRTALRAVTSAVVRVSCTTPVSTSVCGPRTITGVRRQWWILRAAVSDDLNRIKIISTCRPSVTTVRIGKHCVKTHTHQSKFAGIIFPEINIYIYIYYESFRVLVRLNINCELFQKYDQYPTPPPPPPPPHTRMHAYIHTYIHTYTTQKNLRVRRYFRHYFLNVNYVS